MNAVTDSSVLARRKAKRPASSVLVCTDKEVARELLIQYYGRVKEEFGNLQLLRVLLYDESALGRIACSHPFAVALLDEEAEKLGYRVARMPDLDWAFTNELPRVWGRYEDAALVLHDRHIRSCPTAASILPQARTLLREHGSPLMVHLRHLRVQRDDGSQYGLRFELSTDFKPVYAPCFEAENDGLRFTQCDIEGLPRGLRSVGPRLLHTYPSGVVGLRLNQCGTIDASRTDFGSFSRSGQIVLVKVPCPTAARA